jgi:hyperosmotically inducible protein
LAVGGCSKSPEAAAPAPPPVAQIADVDVTEHVKTALQQSESLKGFEINVATLKGDVRLTGVLDNQAQIDEAIKLARSSEGAHAIHDELTIKK